ncbi:oxysterol-binding protein-related protein 10-like [Osmerus mordax]|uniref:oxysterol-binding protein-related protein 10-like n=1 Tax=Osmerus mordax TaxID=8014 RepID=UPI00350F7B3E
MEKTICGPHPGTNKTNSGSLPSDRGNSSKKIGRTGSHSPGSASLGSSAVGGGGRGGVLGNSMNLQLAKKRQLEGVLCKYTNLIQGWQNRYFVLDPELGQLQYFVNEQGRSQKPRGSLPMIGASVTPSDEAPHMFIVNSVNGELYKLRASDAKEQQFWMNQLQACARRHSDSSAKGRNQVTGKQRESHTETIRVIELLIETQTCNYSLRLVTSQNLSSRCRLTLWVLCLQEHDEEYVFTLPCAYARSILTVPWVELGGKVTISCAKSGYAATVTFHTKPFYGGKVHRVTAEVKHVPTNTIVCKAQGEWNGTLEFTYSSGETKVIDTTKLPIIKKKLRPVEKQGRTESRQLWQHVTRSLKEGNMDEATEHKHVLEERQRAQERQRSANNTPWTPTYFSKEGDGWIYNNPLWKSH